jgi:hypothetical protein
VGIGVLFWVSNLVTLVGGVIAGVVPSDAATALNGMHPHASQVVAGTLIAHVNDFAIIGYGVLLYPVLAPFSRSAALGYAAFKVVEAVLLLVAAVTLFSLIGLSQSYLDSATGASGAAALKASAEMALSQQFWATRLAAFAYLVSTPVLTFVLYRTQLVPGWLSVWGFVACVLLATGLALGVGDPTRGFEVGHLLVIPIIVWELTWATWLIVKGFDVPAAQQLAAIDRLGKATVAA